MEPDSFYSGSESKCLASGHDLVHLNDDQLSVCFTCKGSHVEHHPITLYCKICNFGYHEGCQYYKPDIIHPFHLSHPLALSINHNSWQTYDDDVPKGRYKICSCCGDRLDKVYYHCSICNYNINVACTQDPPDLTIVHPKSHNHTLTLFPGRFTWPCKACGKSLDDTEDLVYTCLPCNYIVHKTCIYLPRVIKITRHQHRLSYSSSLPHGDFSCGVCRQTVDINYGQYSCTNGCHYAVHSKCATREDVWDGKDLEGVPEEPEEDIEPFLIIDEETIQHFSHEHYLRLHMNYIPSESQYIFCQVCTLPIITSFSFYSCMQCDFVLDESCACLPRKLNHLLHKHPLTLLPIYPSTPNDLLFEKFKKKGTFECDGCLQESCGFLYICSEKDCKFQLDTRCASLPDPFNHDFHQCDHPLFFILINYHQGYDECMVCKNLFYGSECVPQCMQCNFVMCIKCATIPLVTHYKYDKHPLTLCYGEEDATDLKYWCEICESQLDASEWFYTCDYCRVTLHLTCLLGKDPYMKPNHIFTREGNEIETALNGNPRPFCDHCDLRCIEPLVFKRQDRKYCSYSCIIMQIEIQGEYDAE